MLNCLQTLVSPIERMLGRAYEMSHAGAYLHQVRLGGPVQCERCIGETNTAAVLRYSGVSFLRL